MCPGLAGFGAKQIQTRGATNRSPQSQLKLYHARRRRKWPQEVTGSTALLLQMAVALQIQQVNSHTASDAGRRPKYPGKAEERNIGAIRIIHPAVHPWNTMRKGVQWREQLLWEQEHSGMLARF